MIVFALRLIELRPCLIGDDGAHRVHDGRIPGGGHADGLRKDRGVAGARDTVKGLVPGLIVRYAEARNGGRPILKLAGLLFQRHAADQIMRALRGRKLGVAIILRLGRAGKSQDRDQQTNTVFHGAPLAVLPASLTPPGPWCREA